MNIWANRRAKTATYQYRRSEGEFFWRNDEKEHGLYANIELAFNAYEEFVLKDQRANSPYPRDWVEAN